MKEHSGDKLEIIPCIVPATGSYVINLADTHADYYTVVSGLGMNPAHNITAIVRKSKVIPISNEARNFYTSSDVLQWPSFTTLAFAYAHPTAIQISHPGDIEYITENTI